MASNYEVEKAVDGTPLTRENVQGKGIYFVEGKCMADTNEPKNKARTNKSFYLENVLKPGIESGKIGDGVKSKWDDRKPRLESIALKGHIEVKTGITYFGENKSCISRGEKNPEEAVKLHRLGEDVYGDRYAFFARAPGVSGAVISLDGKMILGVRLQEDSQGLLHPVGGYLPFKENPADINIDEQLRNELHEEFGVLANNIANTRFVGIYGNPLTGEVDFVHHVYTTLPVNYFTSGEFRKNAIDKEHGDIVVIPDLSSAEELLKEGTLLGQKRNLMYTARGSLEALRLGDLF
ncbi:MAG: hypothetical protein AABX73_00835 [Nanoarchaeota archaeon]